MVKVVGGMKEMISWLVVWLAGSQCWGKEGDREADGFGELWCADA